jgi:hypothetical protein
MWDRQRARKIDDLAHRIDTLERQQRITAASQSVSLGQIGDSALRAEQETGLTSYTGVITNSTGFKTQYTVSKPDWATHAAISFSSGEFAGTPVISGSGEIQLYMIHDSVPITSSSEAETKSSSSLFVSSSGVAALTYGRLVDMRVSDTLYTRPYATSLVAGSQHPYMTLVSTIQWLEI